MTHPGPLLCVITTSLLWKTLAAVRCEQTGGLTWGKIQSPNYPSNYGSNQVCEWSIRAGEGNRIKATFEGNFSMEQHSSCNFDHIELIDADPQTGNALKSSKFCGSQRPDPFISSTSMTYVRFKSDGSNENIGFSMSWKRIQCEFQLEGYRGEFGYTEEDTGPCTWNISVPPGNVVHLAFSSTFDLGAKCNGVCCGDTIQIYDVMANGSSVTRGQWCGTDTPPTLTSFTSNMFVRLHRRNPIGGRSFSATWTAESNCTWTFNASEGYAMSYDYPYDSGAQNITSGFQNCRWEIVVPDEHRVILSVHHLKYDKDCTSLQILSHRYRESDALVIPRQDWCVSTSDNNMADPSQTTISPMELSSSRVLLGYEYGDSGSTGFYVSWKTECGQRLSGPKGNFSSPGYGIEYPPSQDCEWVIKVEDHQMIHLEFSTTFDVETSKECCCTFDYVEVFDSTPTDGLVSKGKFCNGRPPPKFLSSSNELVVRFHSDNSKQGNGFSAFWYTECGKIFKSPNGTFTSPGFPEQYPNSMSCRWVIPAIKSHRVKLQFGSIFDLEMNKDNCRFDGVEVLESLSNGTLVSYGKWCSVREIPVFYSWYKLVVLFYSDSGKTGRGFSASWESVSGCEDIVGTGDAGYLSSPRFPDTYPHYLNCSWTIQPVQKNSVILRFDPNFQLEKDNDCDYDYVEVLVGGESQGLWCGSNPPHDVTSNGQPLTVKFVSDHSVNATGFYASWE